jgi:hypothetical protein
LLAPWNASGFSEALNSLGELDNDFDSEDDAPILTAASVTWALASSTAETIELTAEADTLVDVPVVRSGAAATSLAGY